VSALERNVALNAEPRTFERLLKRRLLIMKKYQIVIGSMALFICLFFSLGFLSNALAAGK
jgi:hypothetical protein